MAFNGGIGSNQGGAGVSSGGNAGLLHTSNGGGTGVVPGGAMSMNTTGANQNNLERGSDCLIRDAQRIVTLSATEAFGGVDGVVEALLPFHIYGRQGQLDTDYSYAMSLLASEVGGRMQSSEKTGGGDAVKAPVGATKVATTRAMRRMMSSRTDVFEAQMVHRAGEVRKRLGRLQRRIEGLAARGGVEKYCSLMLHVSDAASRAYALREAKERAAREEKRKQAEKIAEEKRLLAAREEQLRLERIGAGGEVGGTGALAVGVGTGGTGGGAHQPQGIMPHQPQQQPLQQMQQQAHSGGLRPSGSIKLKLSMKKEAPQSLRAGSGANFLTSPAGQTSLSLASHNPQMSGDASRMSPGLTDGGTLVDSRAMSMEIEMGSKQDVNDDVVSSGHVRDVAATAAVDGSSTGVGGAGTVGGAGAIGQGGAAAIGQGGAKAGAPVTKPQVSGKFKLMKLMKKKK